MPENQATSLSWPERITDMAYTPCPRNYLEMPRNQATSLSQSGRTLDKACKPYLEITQKCLKINLHPCHGLDASRTRPVHRVRETA
ncbi:Hypothetical predicted protein [Olea europaea subsp. europaea]|uniref:Uncharacterized protein n=1 Tax=Olea europaea subsp. europaea TaxID=158383 RepID=A0A8S0PL79_OLEEU|nr:Hypothetical predicted protein [Olea europaea subsp. europaea]